MNAKEQAVAAEALFQCMRAMGIKPGTEAIMVAAILAAAILLEITGEEDDAFDEGIEVFSDAVKKFGGIMIRGAKALDNAPNVNTM